MLAAGKRVVSILTLEAIKLAATVTDKNDAIRQAGELLVKAGHVKEGYVPGMLEREQTMSTYMGNGVAIPHGMYESRELILKTGISVLQIPAGVEWEDGEIAYLVIGIAADNDEHMGILMNLADALEDEESAQELVSLSDPEEIIARLAKEPEEL